MSKKITQSIVADNGSKISNAKNVTSIRKIHPPSLLLGLILGVISSLVATYIWEHIVK